MKKKLLILISLMLLLVTFAACGTDTPDVDAEDPQENEEGSAGDIDEEQYFIFSSGSAVLGLDPVLNTTAPDNGLHHFILETLVAGVVDEDGYSIIKPAAAEDWDISDDGTVYTFYIRENAKWNDGVDVVADDFVYTFQTMANPETGSTNAWLFDGIILNFAESLYSQGKNPEDIGVSAIDEKTVEFTLTKPHGYFLDLLDGAKPIRQDKYEEWGSEYGSSADRVVTNGPFQVDSWNQNTQMTLVKNEHYWDVENVILDRIERKVIQDASSAVQALIGGEIDVVSTNEVNWQQVIEDDGRFKSLVTPSAAPEFFAFNAGNEYFSNPKIRLAFSLGFDREKFVDDLLDGSAIPLYSLMPSNINVGQEPYHERVNGENEIVKALQQEHPDPRELLIEGLEEAGLDPDPANMEINFATRGTGELSRKISEWMLQEWEENLGVSITIDMMEWNIMWDKVDEGDYDIVNSGWGPYYNDPNGLLEIYHPEDGYFDSSKSGWTGPDAERYAELLEEASNTTDNQERAELFLEAEKILVGTGVIAPSYVLTDNTYLADYVGGYYVNPHSYVDYTKVYTSGR